MKPYAEIEAKLVWNRVYWYEDSWAGIPSEVGKEYLIAGRNGGVWIEMLDEAEIDGGEYDGCWGVCFQDTAFEDIAAWAELPECPKEWKNHA